MSMATRGLRYMRAALSLALGGGAALGSTYVVSRIKEKQNVESRLDRLEQMLGRLTEIEEAKKAPKPRTRTKTATKKQG